MAKRRRTLGRGRREQLLLHQVHALDHYRKPGICTGHFPNPPRRTALTCPICAHDKPFDRFSEEHAPPAGGQSVLGPPTTIVLTCRSCNTSAGDTFEGDAADRAQLDTADDLPHELTCEVHGKPRTRRTEAGLHIVASEEPVVVTDLKAAFVLAFATLGYSWALSRELLPVRTAIQIRVPPDPAHAWSGSVQLSDNPQADKNAVLEVGGPEPCLIVRAENGSSVLLPVPGHPSVPRKFGKISVRTWQWPTTLGQGHYVDREHRAGRLFHADFCRRQHWSS